MQVIDIRLPKLCHAKPGDCVRLPDRDGNLTDELFMVCAFPVKGKRAARPLISHGLYDDERPLFLVSLETGLAREMPHLSSRAEIVRDVVLVQGASQAELAALTAKAAERNHEEKAA